MAGSYRRVGSNWRAEVMVDGVRVSRNHRSKRLAEQWVAQQMQKSHGEYPYTFLELVNRYVEEISPTHKGGRHEVIRLDALNKSYPALFSKKIESIQAKDIREFVDQRLKTVKPSTVNRELNLISAVFTQGVAWEMCSSSPTRRVKRPTDPPPRERRVSPSEQKAILFCLGYSESEPVTSNSHRVAIAWLIAIETAMRQGEIARTKKVDVNLERKTLYIPRSITKTGNARKIPLSGEAIRLIRRLPDTHTELMLGVNAGVISTLWRRARDRAGVIDMTFHDSRHEATTRLAQKLHVLDLARVTGHKDLKQLMVYYNRSAEDMADLL